MRPTVTEQLAGLRRILADVVAPQIAQPYPAEILAGVVASLGALESAWPALPAFLRWDCESTAAVLGAALPIVDTTLAAEVSAAAAEAATDPLDITALELRQRHLRGLLARAAPAIMTDPGCSAYGLMAALMRERAERYPFAIAAAPARPAAKQHEGAGPKGEDNADRAG